MFVRISYRFLSFVLLFLTTGAITLVYADTLQRGPYLQMGTPDSMTIRWRTDVASDSSVQYGTDLVSFPANTVTDAAVTTEHEIILSGLSPDTKYFYAVLDSSGAVLSGQDSDHFFITSPPIGMPNTTRVWVIGDSGTANASAAAVYSAFRLRAGPDYTDLWIMLGDNAYNDGTDGQYQTAVFEMYPELLKQTPLWTTLGNHDGHSADSASQTGPYYDIFTLPTNAEAGGVASGTEAYYSFDYGQIHFICLESYETNRDPGGAMLTWLENDLQATTRKWIVAFWHHPPYTKGSHDSDGEGRLIDMRENALPILDRYGVDLVLSGHSHSYERSFLLDGHYGSSGTLAPSMILDGGDGDKDGDGEYFKTETIKDPNTGAVYIVAGSSGKVSGGSLDHPAMLASINSLGSVLLEVTDNEMNAIFIDQNNTQLDTFSIVKGPDTVAPTIVAAQAVNDTTIDVNFSERLDMVSAEDSANYAIDQSVTVSSASLSADKRTVTLTTSTLAPAVNYTVTVNNVEDEAGNPIAANSQASLTFVNLITMEFQNGALPDSSYAGAEDAYLAQASATSNNGSSSNLFLDGDDGGGVDLSSVLRWDISAIRSDAIIESAALTIEVFDPSNSSYSVHALNRPWVESEVTWNQHASGNPWQTAGAFGANDREATVLANLSPAIGNHTINLNNDGIAVVQSWVDGSRVNNGIIVGDTASTDGVDFYSSESSTITDRPKLTVVYSLPAGGGDSEPPTVPGNLHTTAIGATTVSLAWDDSTDNVAVAGYKVFRDGGMVADVNTNSFDDSSLSPATAYDYWVSAYDAANNESGAGTTLAVTTQNTTADMHVDAIDLSVLPVGKRKIKARAVIAVVDQDGAPLPGVTVSVDWSGVVNQSVTEITGAGGVITIDSANVSKNTTGEFVATVTNLSASGFNYTPGDNVEGSDCVTTDSQPCAGSLPAPTGLSADYDGSAVNLDWSDVTLADSYTIHRSTASGSGYIEIGASATAAYVDTTVAAFATYYYVVTSVAGVDESGFSNEATVDTTVSVPITLHTDNVTVSLKKKGSRYDATAVVSVIDAGDGSPVSGASVSGSWTIAGLDAGNGQDSTDAGGQATVKISRQPAQSGDEIRFTVTNIVRGDDDFDGVETSGFAIAQ